MSVTARAVLDGVIPNDQWMTGEEVPDPSPLPRIPGVGILVRPVPIRHKTSGGILLPDTFRQDREYLNTVGRVLVLGELAFEDREIYKNGCWVKPGDYIVYSKFSGSKFYWKGVKLLLVKPSAIELIVDKPEYLDSNFKD